MESESGLRACKEERVCAPNAASVSVYISLSLAAAAVSSPAARAALSTPLFSTFSLYTHPFLSSPPASCCHALSLFRPAFFRHSTPPPSPHLPRQGKRERNRGPQSPHPSFRPAARRISATAARPSAPAAWTSARSLPALSSRFSRRSSEGVTAKMMPGPAVHQAAAYASLKGVVAFARHASTAPAMDREPKPRRAASRMVRGIFGGKGAACVAASPGEERGREEKVERLGVAVQVSRESLTRLVLLFFASEKRGGGGLGDGACGRVCGFDVRAFCLSRRAAA